MQGTETVRNFDNSRSNEIWYLTFEAITDYGGGLATYIRNVMAAAREEKRPVRIFQVARGAHTVTRTVENGINIVNIPDAMPPKTAPLGYWMHLSWRFAEFVCFEISRCGKPRAIETPDGFALGYFLFQRKLVGEAVLQGVPLILVAHTPIAIIDEWCAGNLFALPNWWTFRAEKWCFRAADAVVTLSSMLVSELFDRGYVLSEVRMWPSVNPYIRFKREPTAPVSTNGDEAITAGMASRMINWKGLRETLSVAKAAKAANMPIRFELCGGLHGDFERARKDFSSLFDEEVVTYLGVLDAGALDKQRATWSFQLHPSLKDNFPYAVIEALARGLPCYIGPGNGVAEALPGALRDILVVDFARPDQVLAATARADRARQLLQEFDFDIFGAKAYFADRDRLISKIDGSDNSSVPFPFVDRDQARAGLRPKCAIAPSASGARLTVVVPYYNMGPYIEDCISSVLRSSVVADIVIVNDGSDDPASIASLDAYRKESRIRVFDIPNGGVARARNFGVNQATTEFVALLDADDTVESSYYQKALYVLDRYDNVGFVGCWSNDFQDGSGETTRFWPTYNAEPMPNIIINNTNCQALVYRTNVFHLSGRHDPALNMYLDDWDAMLGMLEAGVFGVMLPEPLLNYRQRAASIFSSGRAAWDANYAYIVRKHAALFQRNATEALLFSNANGPNRNFHLLGNPTSVSSAQQVNQPWGRLKMPHRLARSVAKRLMRFSEKGYRH